jgi:acetyl/propionyl-CoA carboxylase alpha subunit
MKYTVIVAGETLEVSFQRDGTRIQATIGDRIYTLEASVVRPGVCLLNWNFQSIEVTVLPNGGSYSVSIGGRLFPVEILDDRKLLNRARPVDRGGSGDRGISEIRASMPGKIVRILTVEGADVQRQHGIVVMEAMKMQNEIKSTIDGRVLKITVIEGETVRAGDLIAIVDARKAEAEH